MIKEIHACCVNDGKSYTISIDPPRRCPYCESGIDARFLSAFFVGSKSLSALYFCPLCEEIFTVRYGLLVSYGAEINTYPIDILPHSQTTNKFPSDVVAISPKFAEIVKQAELAEKSGLNEICGLGYRKALEFLVKDYASMIHPEEVEQIRTLQLSPCISKFIESERIRTLATASAWIGNDETHYIRKLEDYDLSYLKAFIDAIVSYINSDCAFYKAKSIISKDTSHKSS